MADLELAEARDLNFAGALALRHDGVEHIVDRIARARLGASGRFRDQINHIVFTAHL